VAIGEAGGMDRYGEVFVRRGPWLLQNINWVNRDGSDSASLLLLGRQVRIARDLELGLLVGQWYEYANRAWDQTVFDTNIHYKRGDLTAVAINHWGFPSKRTGELFDAHTQSITGFPKLPKWLGVSSKQEHEPVGMTSLWLGPMMSERKEHWSVTAVPYWDFHRRSAAFRVMVSYTASIE
jgi:hypothetical protein